MSRLADVLEESNRAGMGFLLTELDTALTFLGVAEATRDRDTAVRNRDNARVAYECVLRYQGPVHFQEEEKVSFENKLAEVKRALIAAGVSV